MNILWCTWKDCSHPRAGGAELVHEELAKRLVQDGHSVLLLVGGYPGCIGDETKDGYRIIRLGNRFTLYWHAYRYYATHLKNWPDLVIETINTIPFFTTYYDRAARRVLFIHQLAREIWFYEMPFPLSLIGYLLEPLYLRLLNDQAVITVSESTKKDLLKYGFKSENIHIIPEGIALKPIPQLHVGKKFDQPTILALGELRSMKRVDHILRAFAYMKNAAHLSSHNSPQSPLTLRGEDRHTPSLDVREGGDELYNQLKLIIAGSHQGTYAQKILRMIARSPYKDDIVILGKIDEQKKIELLQQSHLLCVTSVKEGWGLVVTEAASQGTPAVVYNVDGLRDSVRHGETGIVCEQNSPECLADNIMKLLSNPAEYERLRTNAWAWSREFTFERSYQECKDIISNPR